MEVFTVGLARRHKPEILREGWTEGQTDRESGTGRGCEEEEGNVDDGKGKKTRKARTR